MARLPTDRHRSVSLVAMARYKCLVNGGIDDDARRRVEAGLARLAHERLGIDPATVSVEFTVVPDGRWYTAGRPSRASMVLGTVPPGTDQATRVTVLEAMARLFCDATGADFDDVMVVAADQR
jgi:phenylpyruvate tautomerase PptA (4-oxalocrotonate tautomerase family)